jgi:hypothetical protein
MRYVSMRCYTLRCDAMRCDAMRCDAMRCAALCFAALCLALLCSAALRCDTIRDKPVSLCIFVVTSERHFAYTFYNRMQKSQQALKQTSSRAKPCSWCARSRRLRRPSARSSPESKFLNFPCLACALLVLLSCLVLCFVHCFCLASA